MKRNYLLLIVLIGITNNIFSKIQTKIFKPNEATIYYSGLTLYGENFIQLKKGVNEIKIKGIDSRCNKERFLMSLGSNKARIISMHHYSITNNEKTFLQNAEYKRATDSAALINNQIVDIRSDIKVLDLEYQLIIAHKTVYTDKTSFEPNKLDQLADIYRKRLGYLLKTKLVYQKQINKLDRMARKLNATKRSIKNKILTLGTELDLTIVADYSLNTNLTTGIYLEKGGLVSIL